MAASPLVKYVCFHSPCVQLPNNVPRAFSADLKCIRPFVPPHEKTQRRLGTSSSRPSHCWMTHSDLGDYCYTRQKKMLYVCQELSVINELLCWLSIGSWAGHRGWWMHNKQTLHRQQAAQSAAPPHDVKSGRLPFAPHTCTSSLGYEYTQVLAPPSAWCRIELRP